MSKADEIQERLREVENDRPIEIQSARIMGSRSINASHDGSDWDIMFLYTFDEPWKYVAPGYSLETIYPEEGGDDEIEPFGWNINMFNRRLQDSDPHTIRFLRSPKEYINNLNLSTLRSDAVNNFNHMSLYSHYRSLAESNYRQYIENGNDKTKGRQFYILHALAYVRFVREEGELPPLNVEELAGEFAGTTLGKRLQSMLYEKRKRNGNEEIHDITGDILEQEPYVDELEPTDQRTRSPSKGIIADTTREALQ